jgi:hypothetical protein
MVYHRIVIKLKKPNVLRGHDSCGKKIIFFPDENHVSGFATLFFQRVAGAVASRVIIIMRI